MNWWNPLEEDLSFGKINILIHPLSPCWQGFLVCNQTIHVSKYLTPICNEIPPAIPNRYSHMIPLNK